MSLLMGLVITKTALDNLAKIPHKIRVQLIKKVKALILNPRPNGAKKLKGITTDDGEPVYRHRSGDYRILYVVRKNPGGVIVLDIDDRKDVYK
jgi:mRNA interferase RelE/StbE